MQSRIRTRVARSLAILENRLLDLRFAGRLLTRVIGGVGTGAKATVSTDYFVIRKVFEAVPVNDGDVLVDVGCGLGRLLYFWAHRFPRNRLTGVELNTAIAGELQARLGSRAEIIAGDVLASFPGEGTIYYLANPFGAEVVEAFLRQVEQRPGGPVTVIYVFPVHGELLLSRIGWDVREHRFTSRARGIDMRVLTARSPAKMTG